MLELFGVVDPDAGKHHANEEDHEEEQVGDQQSMITQLFADCAPISSRRLSLITPGQAYPSISPAV